MECAAELFVSGGSVDEECADYGSAEEAPSANKGRWLLEPPVAEAIEARRPECQQHQGASELEPSEETHQRRKATGWRANHEDQPEDDTERERHRKPDDDPPSTEKASEEGWGDYAE